MNEREKWLMKEAFNAGYGIGHSDGVEGYINDEAFYEWINTKKKGVTLADTFDERLENDK